MLVQPLGVINADDTLSDLEGQRGFTPPPTPWVADGTHLNLECSSDIAGSGGACKPSEQQKNLVMGSWWMKSLHWDLNATTCVYLCEGTPAILTLQYRFVCDQTCIFGIFWGNILLWGEFGSHIWSSPLLSSETYNLWLLPDAGEELSMLISGEYVGQNRGQPLYTLFGGVLLEHTEEFLFHLRFITEDLLDLRRVRQ